MRHIPRKRFGQHFLTDQNIINKIILALSPQKDQHWVEIGPGQGALTTELLVLAGKLDAIELDRDLIADLKKKCELIGDLQLYQGDVLRFDLTQLYKGKPLNVFGNLPYNISTPLIFHLLDFVSIIEDMHFMLQKEVAERIAANPGSKQYGPLSVMLQYHCQAQLLFFIGPSAFSPPPKVESAFVRLIPHLPTFRANDTTKLRNIVRQAFSQRRKMLRNSLKEITTPAQLEQLKIDPNSRPEQLTVEDFVKISNIH